MHIQCINGANYRTNVHDGDFYQSKITIDYYNLFVNFKAFYYCYSHYSARFIYLMYINIWLISHSSLH